MAQLAEAEADRAAELQRATDLHRQEELQLRREEAKERRDTFKALADHQVAQQAAAAAQQASMATMFGQLMEAFVASNTSSTATDHVPTTLLAAFEEEDDHNTDGEADVQWIVPVDTAAATPSAKKAKRAAKGRGKTVHRVAPSTFQGKIYCARK